MTGFRLRSFSVALALLGILVAGYLTWSYFSEETSFLCAPGGGCDTVRQSRFSAIGGVPVAALGLFGYLSILAVLLLEQRGKFLAANGPMIVFGLTLIGFLYSLYLTYLELFVILAICLYCVSSAVIITLLFILAAYRMVRSLEAQ